VKKNNRLSRFCRGRLVVPLFGFYYSFIEDAISHEGKGHGTPCPYTNCAYKSNLIPVLIVGISDSINIPATVSQSVGFRDIPGWEERECIEEEESCDSVEYDSFIDVVAG